ARAAYRTAVPASARAPLRLRRPAELRTLQCAAASSWPTPFDIPNPTVTVEPRHARLILGRQHAPGPVVVARCQGTRELERERRCLFRGIAHGNLEEESTG